MADAKTHAAPDGTPAMPTQSEMAPAHEKTNTTLDQQQTHLTLDEKGNISPGNSIVDDHPQKSKRSFMTLNFWICFAISLGQIAFGYPASIIATTLGQPAFLLYMGLVKEDGSMGENANALIGATSGVFQVGFFTPLFPHQAKTKKWQTAGCSGQEQCRLNKAMSRLHSI